MQLSDHGNLISALIVFDIVGQVTNVNVLSATAATSTTTLTLTVTDSCGSTDSSNLMVVVTNIVSAN